MDKKEKNDGKQAINQDEGRVTDQSHSSKNQATSSNPKDRSVYRIKEIRKYKTLEERVKAKRRDQSKYQEQFTDKGIAEKKRTLEGAKLDEFLKRAKHFRERQKQNRKQIRERRQEANLSEAKKKKAEVQSPEEIRAASIGAANLAAFSQLSTTPKFMQKLKDGTTSSTKEKQSFFKGTK